MTSMSRNHLSVGCSGLWCATGLLRRAVAVLVVLAGTLVAAVAGDKGAAPSDEQVAERLKLTVAQVRQLHTERALSNESLWHLPPDKLARALWRLEHPRPDLPEEAAQFRLLLQQ